MSNLIRVLAAHYVPLTDTVLIEAYEWVVEQECDVKDLLLREGLAESLVATLSSARAA